MPARRTLLKVGPEGYREEPGHCSLFIVQGPQPICLRLNAGDPRKHNQALDSPELELL